METIENVDDKNSPPKEKAKNTICFFFLGVLLFIFDEMCLTAAEDIISGSRIATTSVIIAIALPVLAVKTFVPWFLQMCSYLCKTCIVVCLLLTGLVVVVWVEDVQWRLFGVSVVESGTSVGEITFLALTASYQDTTVSAFVAGIGAASLLGPLYYTGLTTWLCVAPKITIMTTFAWPFLVFILYWILDKKDNKVAGAAKSEEHKDVSYTRLTSSADCDDSKLTAIQQDALTLREKFLVAKQISPYILFLFLTYFAEYLSNQGIITTLAFSNSSFSPRDHYQYYIVCYHMGKFLGRSHIFVLSCTCSNVVPHLRIRRTWILALVEIAHTFFFLAASWFRFVPHVSIILTLCFTEGFVAGSMYVNSAYAVSDEVSDQRKKEFALGLLTFGDGLGKLSAGFLGLLVEPQLRSHCVNELQLGENCITRHHKASGWTKNERCIDVRDD